MYINQLYWAPSVKYAVANCIYRTPASRDLNSVQMDIFPFKTENFFSTETFCSQFAEQIWFINHENNKLKWKYWLTFV